MFAARNAFMTGSAAPAASVTFLGVSAVQAVGTSFSYTVPTGASLMAVVVGWNSNSTTGTGVTVDSTSITRSVRSTSGAGAQNTLDIYTQLNPTVGSRTILASGPSTGTTNTAVYVLTYSNCSSLGTTYSASTSGSSSITFSTVANGLGLYGGYFRSGANTIVMSGTGLTSRAATARSNFVNINVGDIPSGTATISPNTAVPTLYPLIAGIQLLPT